MKLNLGLVVAYFMFGFYLGLVMTNCAMQSGM